MPKFDDPEEAYRKAREEILRVANEGGDTLALNGWGLAALPWEIGQCHKLRQLWLQDNQLSILPSELAECAWLEELGLSRNRLLTLPLVLEACPCLKRLWLDASKLSTFPTALLQFPQLNLLSLSGTGLTELPPEIVKLRELKELYLGVNRLTTLPESLRQLPKLEILFLHNNEALGLPPEVLGPTWQEADLDKNRLASAKVILDYYFSRHAGGAKALDEVKMIFAGRGGAGKTSLVNRLVFDRFRKDEAETSGIVITDWTMKDCPGGGPVTAHVWDFAGQVITHAMHQFFFSTRTVYVLVLTGRENAERDDAEYWLRLIAAFGTEREFSMSELARIDMKDSAIHQNPPVIVALNKWDDGGSARARLDRAALRERYPFIVGFVETDCATKRGLSKLRTKLAETVGAMKWVRDGFPAKWAGVKDKLRANPDPHLGYDVFRQICRAEGVADEGEQDSLATALHALGVALNYRDDERLRFASVLKPHWLTENVYALMRHAEAKAGVLPREALPSVLKDEKSAAMRRFLVDMMVRFELAYPLAEEGEEPERWLVPQALPDDQPPGAEAFRTAAEATRLRFSYRALPVNIVPQFIVRTHALLELNAQQERVQWASGAVLSRAGARALVRADKYERLVEVTVTGPADSRQELAGLCQAELRSIHAFIRGLNPHEEMQVVSRDERGRALSGWLSVKGLERDEAMQVKSAVTLDEVGTVEIDPVEELNEFTKPAARDDSWKPRVFICYSQKDDRSRKTLEMHLKILRTQGVVEAAWTDQALDPGEDWDQRIKQELDRADVILMLVSASALATDYIRKVEMPRALERHAAGQALAVSIILEQCGWSKTDLAKWQVIQPHRKAVLDHKPQRNGWAAVEEKLHELFARLRREHGAGSESGKRSKTP